MLTDFGVALSRSLDPVRADQSRAFGTPHYMSPEQAVGELDIDGRSDIYSLGILAYYMLSGELPFDGATFESLAARHIADAYVPLKSLATEAPGSLIETIDRCLQKDRTERWSSGRELADALATVVARRRWFGGSPASKAVLRAKIVTELALFAAAMRAVFKWTMI
jgi:serine/threonine-protein kinase